jgi:hypothetical protein
MTGASQPQQCQLDHLRLVCIVRQYDHYTVTQMGESDELDQEEIVESGVAADYPYHCGMCYRDFETWEAAWAHLE